MVNANGSPVTGQVTIRARLAYTNDLSNANTFCTQDISNVDLTNGVFHVKFDFVCKISGSAVTLTQFLSQTPAGESVAIQVTDMTHSKSYSYQALHALPYANVATQLVQNGAGDGEFLKWSDSAKGWVPGTVSGITGGTVTNVTVSAPLSVATSTSTPSISLPQATGAQSGYLSSADWTTFNNKEGTIAGGTATQFYRGDKSWQTLDTSAVPENVNLYFTNARALGVPLTGFSATSSAIVATDSTIAAFGKAQGQINTLSSDSTHFLKKDNTDSITGTVNVGVTGSLTITNAPALPTDAANRQYVNTYADTKLALTGGTLSGALNLDSDLKIKGGSNYVTVRGHATSAAYNFVLPQTAGTGGQFLQTDGSGNLSWVAQSSTATPSGAAGGDLAGTYPNPTVPGLANKISTTLTSGNILVGSAGNVASSVAVSGDATLSNAGVLTLSNTVTAGTYKSVTVDAKGRVTSGTNPTTLAGYGITDTLVTGVSVTAPITNTGSATVPLIGMPVATGSANGYLSSSDFTTFNNKQDAITSASTINTGSLTTNLQGGLVLNPYNTAVGNTGEIRFKELAAGGSNYVGFKSPDALAGNVIYTLPIADGASGQVLSTNAAGVLSWLSIPSSMAPNGSAGGGLTGTYPNPTIASGLDAAKLSGGNVSNTEFDYLDGVTSSIQSQLNNKQPIDPTLTSLAAYNTNGILVQTAADTFVGRSIAGTANRVTVANGDGVAGNPTINIPTALLPSPVAGDAGKFLKASGADTSAWTMLSSSDITTALGFTPINKAGDTMATGTFTYNGTALLRTLDPIGPTDVATKQYVDGYGQWTKGAGANAGDVYRLTGNVGIGTATPQSPLHIVSGLPSPLIFERTSANNSHIQFKNTVTSVYAGLSPAGYFGVGNNIDLGVSPSLVVLSSGNVGIGYTSPTYKLQVGGNSYDNNGFVKSSLQVAEDPATNRAHAFLSTNNAQAIVGGNIRLNPNITTGTHIGYEKGTNERGSAGIVFETQSAGTGYFRFITATDTNDDTYTVSEPMTILPSGNVGIGVTNPTELLQASGNISIPYVASKTHGYKLDLGNDLAYLWRNYSYADDSFFISQNWYANDAGTNVIPNNGHSTEAIEMRRGVGIKFKTGAINTAPTDKMTIDIAGNVGIGTTAPTQKLTIQGTSVSGGTEQTNISAYTGNGINLAGSISNASQDAITYASGGGGGAAIAFRRGGSYDTYLDFYTNSAATAGAITQAMTINSGGSVGIGTTSPIARLEVNGAISTKGGEIIMQRPVVGGGWARGIHYTPDGSTNATAQGLAGIGLYGLNTTQNSIYLTFGTAPWTSTTGIQILANGNVGLGTVSPSYKLDVQGGGVNATGGFTSVSDIRLKTNIEYLKSDEALKKITSLNGIYYDWKDQEKLGSDHQIGLIAQQVQKVFPEAIKTNKDGFLSVAYSNLISPVIESIKALYLKVTGIETKQSIQARQIASLSAQKADSERVRALESENSKLKQENAAIKAYLCKKDPSATICK